MRTHVERKYTYTVKIDYIKEHIQEFFIDILLTRDELTRTETEVFKNNKHDIFFPFESYRDTSHNFSTLSYLYFMSFAIQNFSRLSLYPHS